MEAALVHTIPDKTEAVYARSDLFARRRGLMEQWAAYLGQKDGKIVYHWCGEGKAANLAPQGRPRSYSSR